MNTPATGYFSLVQYCPDRSRLEAANIGVLLFVPSPAFLDVRLASSNDRIRRFFQDEAGDLTQLNVMKRMLEHRVMDEAASIRTFEELQYFQTRFANELVFTPPRPIRVENPNVELTQLFEELVGGGRVRRDVTMDTDVSVLLRERLETAEFANKVRRKTVTHVPVLGDEFEADYAFQNGRLNLVKAKEFTQSRMSDVMREAMKLAVDGHLIYKHPDPQNGEQQLFVVGAFGPAAREEQQRIAGMLEDHEVKLYVPETLDSLVERIRATAH